MFLKKSYIVLYEEDLRTSKGLKIDGLLEAHVFSRHGVISIDKDITDKKAVLAHELEHYRQHLFTLTFHPILYTFSKAYRLWSELKAYKKQLNYYRGEDRTDAEFSFAVFISKDYGLDISPLNAYIKLTEKELKK